MGSNSARPKFNALWRSVAYDYVRTHNIVETPAPREETLCGWHRGAAVRIKHDLALQLPAQALAGAAATYQGLVIDALGDALTFDTGAATSPSCLRVSLVGPTTATPCVHEAAHAGPR